MVTTELSTRGRPMRVGAADFPPNQSLHFFMGYTKCEHCKHDLKVYTSPDESRAIAKAFGYSKRKAKAKLAIWLYKWASDV